MFCPECKSEFIEGIIKCPECNVELIDELPEEPAAVFVAYKEALATYNPADIAFLKSVLDSEGIQYFFKGEHFMYVRPLADPARLMIRIDQFEEATQILKDIKLSFMGINLGNQNMDH
ncbi:putative signal transducing protein [Desulfatitalea alkaliphila]|uniref:DUF2007 domain-containing protein n=1 Tax=Desulfatitalea alkaliphila TaxID=2929485 RepID=A0AA41ULI2_9BACT|nr:DUF2007 domain-containing protein [Desulfatitalea alkaliphila]MCJ8502467.1 DUF2007 domain-containing protein [Desulfatitalea alkaliphila]